MSQIVSTRLRALTSPLTAALYDIYQAEERLGWRFDAWLISDLRCFGHLDQREVESVRRQFAHTRLLLQTRILELGRAVAQVPNVVDTTGRLSMESKLQQLVSLHATFRRASRDVRRKADQALAAGQFADAEILQDLLDRHDAICELLEEAFRYKPDAAHPAPACVA